MKVERVIERGRRETRIGIRRGSIESILSEDDMMSLLRRVKGDENATQTEDEVSGSGLEMDTDGEAVTTGDEYEDSANGRLDGDGSADAVEERVRLLDEKTGR
jgi:hypothetical protein